MATKMVNYKNSKKMDTKALTKALKLAYSHDIFQHIASQLGVKFNTRQKVKAWFREDKNPSASIYKNKAGEYKYKDWAGVEMDCIDCWAMAFTRTKGEAISEIKQLVGLADGTGRAFSTPIHIKPPEPTPEPEPQYINPKIILASCNTAQYPNNYFVQWLVGLVGKDVAYQACQRYNVGTSHSTLFGNGAVVFWYVDKMIRIRQPKIVPYNPTNGKRVRTFKMEFFTPKPYTKVNGYTPCIFGEHLLAGVGDGQQVCIVESEKTAIVASILYPNYIWLASGGAGKLANQWGVNTQTAKALQGNKILLVVDCDTAGRQGYELAQTELAKVGITCKLVDLFERNDKFDLCDFIVQELTSPQPEHHTPHPEQQAEPEQHHTPQPQHLPTLPPELVDNTQLALLIKTLDLELVNTCEHS
jgi:hypothetical protein